MCLHLGQPQKHTSENITLKNFRIKQRASGRNSTKNALCAGTFQQKCNTQEIHLIVLDKIIRWSLCRALLSCSCYVSKACHSCARKMQITVITLVYLPLKCYKKTTCLRLQNLKVPYYTVFHQYIIGLRFIQTCLWSVWLEIPNRSPIVASHKPLCFRPVSKVLILCLLLVAVRWK